MVTMEENKEFAQAAVDKLVERGVSASWRVVEKNNGTEMVGVTLNIGDVCPTIYVDNTESMDELNEFVDRCMEIADMGAPEIDMDKILTKKYAKAKLKARLANRYANRSAINNEIERNSLIVREVFGDLVMYAVLEVEVNGNGTIKVSKGIAEKLGMSKDEILDIALANSNAEATEDNEALPFPLPFKVITNTGRVGGAVSILNEEFIAGLGEDFWMIPSSVHEVLLLEPNDEMDPEYMTEMIREVNASQLRPEEVLSDHPYRIKNGKVVLGGYDPAVALA